MEYFRIALANVRKSAHDFAIYFVTLVLGVAAFYAFNTASMQREFLDDSDVHVAYLEVLTSWTSWLTIILAVVMGLFMVYANNYLLRRRRRELGLYRLLGMRRRRLSLILAAETLLVSLVSLAVGLAMGVFLSQLMYFVVAAFFGATIKNYHFIFSPDAALFTIECFGVIFACMVAMNMHALLRVSLPELLGVRRDAGQVRVRSLPASIMLTLLGLALVIAAYAPPISGNSLFASDAPLRFSVVVVAMAVGTNLLIYGLSALALCMGRRNEGFYYNKLNMFTLRQIAARANATSVSMAAVSMVLFLALTSVTVGMSFVNMLSNVVDLPTDAMVNVYYRVTADSAPPQINARQALAEKGIDFSQVDATTLQLTSYRRGSVEGSESLGLRALADAAGVRLTQALAILAAEEEGAGQTSSAESVGVILYSASQYNELRRFMGQDPIDLEGRYVFVDAESKDRSALCHGVMNAGVRLNLAGQELVPLEQDVDTSEFTHFYYLHGSSATLALVVPDTVLEGARCFMSMLYVSYGVPVSEGDAFVEKSLSAVRAEGSELYLAESPDGTAVYAISAETRTELHDSSLSYRGFISYLAVYIGLVLVVACAAIISIQQLSAANDATASYALLFGLGASKAMVTSSLRRLLAVFFVLPPVIAVSHSAVVLSWLLRSLSPMLLGGVMGDAFASIVMFVLVYVAYFVATYHMTRKIACVRPKR